MSALHTRDWTFTHDYTLAWHPTDDPRIVAVVQQDDDPEAPDYDAQAPFITAYEWGSRAHFSKPMGGASKVPEAWLRARGEHETGLTRDVSPDDYADRFVHIFYGATAHHMRSSIDQYTWAVVFNDPAWREAVGCPDDASVEDITGDVRDYLDGDVFGIGYATLPERTTTETDIPDDLEGWEVTIECWGFYGQNYAAESARAFEHGRPELPELMTGTEVIS